MWLDRGGFLALVAKIAMYCLRHLLKLDKVGLRAGSMLSVDFEEMRLTDAAKLRI